VLKLPVAPPPENLTPTGLVQLPEGISNLGHPGRLPSTGLPPDYEPMIVACAATLSAGSFRRFTIAFYCSAVFKRV